jgi:hypothetical protein
MKQYSSFISLSLRLPSILKSSIQKVNTPQTTINVVTAGTLPNLIAESKKYLITELALSGELNGTDIRFIREMSGINHRNHKTRGRLKRLDLRNTIIVDGGHYYFDRSKDGHNYYYTKANILSEYMFASCNLASIILPSSITQINSKAFDKDTQLTSIILPNKITNINSKAFKGCPKLISIFIPSNVTYISGDAFDGCTCLREIVVSKENPNYSDIEGVLFNKDKTQLVRYPHASASKYVIPENVTSIGQNAFSGCSKLKSITINQNALTIDKFAFNECKGLKEIYCKSPIPPVTDTNIFSDIITCKLHIPKGSYSYYWSAAGWGDIKNLIEE